MRTVQLTPYDVNKVADFMLQASGNDFSDKPSLISSKIEALCRNEGYSHFYELWDAMEGATIAAGQLRQRVIDELTTNYSYFYREHAHFNLLAKLIAAKDVPVGGNSLLAGGDGPRIWSAGCATGEKTYNLAMVLEDARCAGMLTQSYQVVGSDISSRALEVAKSASYDMANVTRMPPRWRNQYCARSGHHYHIKHAIRSHVEFRHESVFAPRPDMDFDVVVCRNMLIYFDKKSVERFCTLLRERVKPGGYLFLGHTEIMSGIDGFTYIAPSVWHRNAENGTQSVSKMGRIPFTAWHS